MLPQLRSAPLTCVLVSALAGGCAQGVTSFGDDGFHSSSGNASSGTGGEGTGGEGGTASGGGGAPVCLDAEICGNGLDDDCDGLADNGCDCTPGQQQSCYAGPSGTQGVGECLDGKQICTAGTWGPCVDQITPVPESCDLLDNDCNGAVDDGNPGGGAVCLTGQPGVCADGTLNCTGGTVVCTATVPPSAEICDGLDNDCNGAVDDGDPGGGQPCSTGLPGVCDNGQLSCQGGTLICEPFVQPSAEICDGLDNNCNGGIDEGNPGGGQPCSTGWPGVCANGISQCLNGAMLCNQTVQPSPEICNDGLDNDCNGVIDNGCSSSCAHSICVTGVALTSGCNTCVTQICAVDSYCCTSSWDSICVGEVLSVCGSSQCGGSSCAHDKCTTGIALTSGCDPCVTQICSYDSFCCSTSWDLYCVDEVTTICGLSCP